ncbi:helix-turn-helix domain-containing protein [Paenibacillus sp. HJGM_3]|uniref:AraC family transcriptional regulator n=1 Tax=Paenibacillus sp. HJGM_3 TaxID=3379816 RepID=UPI00385D24F3
MYTVRTRLTPAIVIHKLITMYYFEFGKDFVFNGEKHDFWEFLYVDKGEIEYVADEERYTLKQGSIIFHKPNEFHRFSAFHGTAPSVIVMTFDCRSKAMKQFENQVIVLNDEERNWLALIVEEGMQAFTFPFTYPLKRRPDAPIGSEQLVQSYLNVFLIRLLRRSEFRPLRLNHAPDLSSAAKEKSSQKLVRNVLHYMEARIRESISLNELSEALHIAKTRLKDEFKKETGHTIMETFMRIKIERARMLIREDNSNFTEISRHLGFSSVHYFSKVFKRETGSTPTEYARTVKARVRAYKENDPLREV